MTEQHILPYEETLKCVQCSYCLPGCPTFESTGLETQSPRGRINLVKLLAEGKIDASVLEDPIDLCLGCRACEDACPVGVQYGLILEQTRHSLNSMNHKVSRIQKWIYDHILPNGTILQILGDFLWIYQKTIGRSEKLVMMLPIPARLREFARITPTIENPISRRTMISKRFSESEKIGHSKKALFFHGCIMDVMFHSVNRQTGLLLSHFKYEPLIPKSQTCCGALHAHAGDIDHAKKLAKQNIATFEKSGADVIVHNAGGCGAMLYEYRELLSDEPEWSERARKFSDAVRDISEIAKEAGPKAFLQPLKARVTYQSSCHLHYVERVKTAPVDVVKSIPGVEYVKMQGYDSCCGSAGIYNLVHFNESMEILNKKMENFQKTKAHYIVTSNPGCYLQMKLGLKHSESSENVRVVHLAELVSRACGLEGDRSL